ncbi:MAG: GNAT family N-acetyltransferase [Blastocatellia bacterium]|nr:GNAT family N-acetyltransferase [Blastocatellia bacterium]
MIVVNPSDPDTVDARQLLEELSAALTEITGNSGKNSFDANDVRGARALFVVASTQAGKAVGCGAFRPLNETTAEVKRMYAQPDTKGVGAAILGFLEAQALQLGFTTLWLETRVVNHRAVAFYERHGYQKIPNFGKYIGNSEAVCLGKQLSPETGNP